MVTRKITRLWSSHFFQVLSLYWDQLAHNWLTNTAILFYIQAGCEVPTFHVFLDPRQQRMPCPICHQSCSQQNLWKQKAKLIFHQSMYITTWAINKHWTKDRHVKNKRKTPYMQTLQNSIKRLKICNTEAHKWTQNVTMY